MKTVFFAILISLPILSKGQVGLGTTNPHPSAQLELNSTTKGFLPPRMTHAQRNAIPSPAQGLMVFCTDCGVNFGGEPQFFNGSAWVNLVGAPATNPPVSNNICGQVWSASNLNVDHYRNGDPIPQVTDNLQWSTLTTGAWCWYNNDSATYAAVYGKLYNWYAVNDPRGLAPAGWHIPTDAEWTTLVTCLGGDLLAGGPLKETGIIHWQTPNGGATNTAAFNAVPGGRRRPNDGLFADLTQICYFWSATEVPPSSSNAYNQYLQFNVPYMTRDNSGIRCGLSVRCIRD